MKEIEFGKVEAIRGFAAEDANLRALVWIRPARADRRCSAVSCRGCAP